MARIEFDDGEAMMLKSDFPPPADRFANWMPITRPYGDHGHGAADERLYRFVRRTDYGASFELHGLGTGYAPGATVDLAERLIAHLLDGGTCAIYTDDKLASEYPVCGLMPDTEPQLTLSDVRTLEYSLSVSLLNLAGSPVHMRCHYGP